MKCVNCGRSMRAPYVVTTGGPLGPKCARTLGVKRPALPTKLTPRLATRWRIVRVDERQESLPFADVAA